MVPSPRRLRRAASIVSYWRDSELIFENYRTHNLISADPIVASLLHCCSEWRTRAQVCSRMSEFTPSSVKSALRQLAGRGFLVQEGSVAARADARLQESWSPWLPAGGLLHFSTKDLPYVSDLGESRRAFLVHARREPAPPAVKRYPRTARVQLPNPNTKGEFPQVLLARRTWREFSERHLDLEDLSTLLWLTCGVQYWVKLPGSIGRVALKTSPSAGARHPLEAYVAALRVRGLPRGLYHYSPDKHWLELVRRGCRSQPVREVSGRPVLVWLSQRPDVHDRRIRAQPVEVSRFSRLSHGDSRRRTCLPDLLPDSDMAGSRPILHHGARRLQSGKSSWPGRNFRVGGLRCGRGHAAAGKRLGTLA